MNFTSWIVAKLTRSKQHQKLMTILKKEDPILGPLALRMERCLAISASLCSEHPDLCMTQALPIALDLYREANVQDPVEDDESLGQDLES